MADNESKIHVHKVLMRTKSARNKYVIQITSIDGGPLILEKRQVFYDQDKKKEVIGRQRGLIGSEVRDIVSMWPEIEAILLEHCGAYNGRGNK